MTRLPLLVRCMCALNRRLLPRDLYEAVGRDINEAFLDLHAEARTSADSLDPLRLFVRECGHLFMTRRDERRRRRRDPLLGARTRPRTSPGYLSQQPQRNPPPIGVAMLDGLLQDLRFAVRTLIHAPVFTLVAIITLALGIGANSAVFSVVNAVLLQPLPYQDADRLALLWTNFGADFSRNWISGPEFVEMREYSTQFDDIAIVYPATTSFTGVGEPEQIAVGLVSGSFFGVLGALPQHGRLLSLDDDTDQAPVVVLSDGFWRRRFAAAHDIVGREINLSGSPVTVVGVLEPGFRILHPDAQFPDSVDAWLPIQPVMRTTYMEMPRGNHGYRGIGRIKDGVTWQQAQADMDAVAARLASDIDPTYYDVDGWGIDVVSMHDDLVREARPALLILLGAVGFVLLIACVNVANLMLTRAAARDRELALRSALGAARGRLMQQLLTESLVLGLAGALGGVVLAAGLVRLLAVMAPAGLPRIDTIHLDGTVLAFTLLVGVLTALLFGVVPGLLAMRANLVDPLKDGGRGNSTGPAGRRVRTGLVTAEVALAMVLLVGAGLMVRSLTAMLQAAPGYSTEQVLTLRVTLPESQYDDDASRAFWSGAIARLATVSGVESVGAITHLPLSGTYGSGTALVEDSRTVAADPRGTYPLIEADRRWVTPGYFETMRYEVAAGRAFSAADNEDATPVVIVDEEFVRRFWPDENPIGKRVSPTFTMDTDGNMQPRWREVVGVVRHARHYDLSTVGREQVYIPSLQEPATDMFVAVRTTADPAAVAASIRDEIWALDPNQPIADVLTMDARRTESVAQPRFNSFLLGAFAVLALLLAAVGIYGVISFSVGQRVNEIGIRMALGAEAGQVRSMILRQGLTLVGAGLAIGLVASAALTRVIVRLLYAVSPSDPLTYVGVTSLLVAVAAVACLVPAARATRVQPVSALRED